MRRGTTMTRFTPPERGRFRVVLLLVLLGPCGTTRAAAPSPDDLATQLDRARVCWAALDPECAEAALLEVRARASELAPQLKIEALRLSAEVALATDRTGDAQMHLLALLELEPRFLPAAWPGPWLNALGRARAAAPDRLPPELSVTLPAEVRPKSSVAIEVHAHDPGGIARCELVLADSTRIVLVSADGVVFRGEIPTAVVRVPEVLVRIEVSDRAGNLASWPAQGAHRLVVSPPPVVKAPPLTSRWWFWTAIGAVVIGATVGLVMALGGDSGGTSEPVVGTIDLVAEFPR